MSGGEQAFFIEKMEPLRVAQGQPAAQGLIGRAPVFQDMLALVARVAPSMATVLLQGESGTGKELVARAVHEASPRAHRALVAVDCSSLPENLFESELFGHERGAFTGANAARGGLVEAASGGTLFLDEVGDIPLAMQVKLLRLLETGTYRRVGSTEPRHADIRVVSATHRDLDRMIQDGRFREDLYYRLSTFPIHLPALRERRDDIPLLAAALLERVAPQRRLAISPGRAAACCRRRTFPATCVNCATCWNAPRCCATATRWSQATWNRRCCQGGARRPAAAEPRQPRAPRGLREIEHAALRERTAKHRGSRAALAAELGISERSLYRKLKAAGAA